MIPGKKIHQYIALLRNSAMLVADLPASWPMLVRDVGYI